jgi:hypothetical protein
VAGKVWLYACGDVHRRSPTGGLANGIERKALAPLGHVVPRTVPAGIVTLGAALTSAKPEITEREVRNECIFEKQRGLFLIFGENRETERKAEIQTTWHLFLYNQPNG